MDNTQIEQIINSGVQNLQTDTNNPAQLGFEIKKGVYGIYTYYIEYADKTKMKFTSNKYLPDILNDKPPEFIKFHEGLVPLNTLKQAKAIIIKLAITTAQIPPTIKEVIK